MSAEAQDLSERLSGVRIQRLPDGRHRIAITPPPDREIVRKSWTTRYPVELIHKILDAKGLFVCDEIMREEDPRYVEHAVKKRVFAYVEPAAFAGKRILDFGCGAGASTMVLCRLLPPCELVGIELESKLIELARLRAAAFGRTSVTLLQSPAGDALPEQLGQFDFVMFNAVFEHLLPAERTTLLPMVWSHLKPGGILFLNQTPYRYSPVEIHTTGGLPLINYLPPPLALRFARRFSRRVPPDQDWETLLRRGIRGATVPEILHLLGGARHAELLEPRPPLGDRIDLWFDVLSKRHAVLKRSVWAALKGIKAVTGAEITPDLSLAIRKVPLTSL